MWIEDFCRVLFTLILAAIFSVCFYSFSLAAVDTSKDNVMELVLNDTVTQPDTVNQDYRQSLRKVITEKSKEEEALNLDIETYVKYLPSQHARGADGKVGIIESANEISYELKAFGKLPVELAFETQYISLNNSTPVKLPSHLTALEARIETTLPLFFDKTYLRLGIKPSCNGENWEASSSSFRLPFHAFAIYQPSEQLTLLAGVAVFPDYETLVVPVAGFIYKPNDKLSFNMIPTNFNINYSLNKKIALFLEGDLSGGEYQVKKDDIKQAILQYNEVLAGGGLKYKVNKYIEASLSAGSVFNRSLKYRDSLGKVSLKNGMYTQFRADISI